jgi:hypothetical protein
VTPPGSGCAALRAVRRGAAGPGHGERGVASEAAGQKAAEGARLDNRAGDAVARRGGGTRTEGSQHRRCHIVITSGCGPRQEPVHTDGTGVIIDMAALSEIISLDQVRYTALY